MPDNWINSKSYAESADFIKKKKKQGQELIFLYRVW